MLMHEPKNANAYKRAVYWGWKRPLIFTWFFAGGDGA